MNSNQQKDFRLSDYLGRAARYISRVPGHTTNTAFITGFVGHTDNAHVNLLVLDESKKKLLGTVNWWQAFRSVHDVPHVSDPLAYKAQHSFDFQEPESGEDYEPEAPRQKNVVSINPAEAPQSQTPDYKELRDQIDDHVSALYGPHACSACGKTIIKRAIEAGGEEFEERDPATGPPRYQPHVCDTALRKPAQEPKREMNALELAAAARMAAITKPFIDLSAHPETKAMAKDAGEPSVADLDANAAEEKAKDATAGTQPSGAPPIVVPSV